MNRINIMKKIKMKDIIDSFRDVKRYRKRHKKRFARNYHKKERRTTENHFIENKQLRNKTTF